MNRKFFSVLVFLIATAGIISTNKLNSHIVNPPPGSTGDPVTGNTCAGQMGCHVGNAMPNDTSILTLKIDTGTTFGNNIMLNNNFTYLPNTTYYIGFDLTSSMGRYGFEIDALTYTQTQAGSFTVTDATHTFLQSAFGGIKYMGHFHADTFKDWVFQWKSPATSTGPITFYFAYNTANGDSTVNGDSIYAGTVTIQPDTVTTTGIKGISNITYMNVFPNPIISEVEISFDLQQSGLVVAELYSLDGKMIKSVYNGKAAAGRCSEVFDMASIPAGIYLLNLKTGGSSVTRKIIKD